MAAKIIGINPGDHIARYQFYRVTLGLNALGRLDFEFSEDRHLRNAYDAIYRTGLLIPASGYERVRGEQAIVVDTYVAANAPSVSVAYLAGRLDDLNLAVNLLQLELVDKETVNDVRSRTAAKYLADAQVKASDFFRRLGEQGKYIKWILALLIIAALLYAASRVIGEVRK